MNQPTQTVETWDFSTGQVWTYSKDTWDPRWWNKIGWPSFQGSDEWGRRTVVWGTFVTGYVVWAYRTCWCETCHEARESTYRYMREERIRSAQ